jgi:hypothetical protein
MERLFKVVPELLECVAWRGSARILHICTAESSMYG